jgi:glycosyltransferase involved in cell wall biosynthesis
MRWEIMDDEGVLTFCPTYGHSFIPKTTLAFFYIHLWRAIRRVIEEWGRPDVIHTQDGYAYYVMKVAKHLGIPIVVSQHSGAFLRRELQKGDLRRYRWAFFHAAKVMTANRFAAIDYEAYRIRASTAWLPNTLDTDVFYPSLGPTRQPSLLHVSSLVPVKRFCDILNAFAKVVCKHPRAFLHVVGGRKYREETERLATRVLPRGSFRFHGYLSREELADLMRSVRGLVVASEQETFSRVLMEAMACGLPVLTTRVGGIPAVVRDGDGLFVDVGDVDQISDGMTRLLEGAHGLDLARISRDTHERFSYAAVGRILHEEHRQAAGM